MRRQIAGLALAAALFGANYAQAYIIDDFQNVNATVSGGSGSCPDVIALTGTGQCVGIASSNATKLKDVDTGLPDGGGLSGTVGGTRDISITATTFGAGAATAGVHIDTSGDFQYSNPSGFATTVAVVYDGDSTQGNFGSSLTDGAGGVDLTDGGVNDLLAWAVTSLDINVRVTVILKDSDGTTAGNAFLKLPWDGVPANLPPACDPGQSPHGVPGNPLVCVIPDLVTPGLLLHGLALFNAPTAGNIDPATGANFYDDPFTAGVDTLLAPTGGPGSLDVTDIVAIKVIYDTLNNSGSPSLDLAENSFFTTTSVPEPGTVLLMGTGLLALGLSGASRRFKRRKQ